MAKKSISNLSDEDFKSKKILVRCDLNVPLDGKVRLDYFLIFYLHEEIFFDDEEEYV